MNILFCLPRQHPNQASWYHTLTDAGHMVRYIVSYSLPINERGDLPEPDIIDNITLPLLYRFFLYAYTLYTGKEAQKPYLLWPDRVVLEKKITDASPTLIIIREALTPLSLVTQSIACKYRIPTVHYSQAPLQKMDGLVLNLLRVLNIVPRFRMSPTLIPNIATRNQKNVFYIPLFVPVAVTAIKEKTDNVVQFLFVGKYIPRKNHLLLLDAFHKILKKYTAHLTMVGSTIFANESYRQEVMNKIEELQLSEYVTIQSDIDPLKMNDLYLSHDAFVLPSINEPFSISPLEAMAYGLPVIVTDTNGCQFHIKSGENGYVVKSNDVKSLVESLEKMFNTKHLTSLKNSALHYAQNSNNELGFLVQFDTMITAITASKN